MAIDELAIDNFLKYIVLYEVRHWVLPYIGFYSTLASKWEFFLFCFVFGASR